MRNPAASTGATGGVAGGRPNSAPAPPSSSSSSSSSTSGPAGGFDSTPFPYAPPGFTLKFTFHRAINLPVADLHSLSSDPYIVAQLNVNLPRRHKQDPGMVFRTPTIRRDTNPIWECSWIVANVPASGFDLKCRLYDEDPADSDDRLGNVHVRADWIDLQWPGIKEREYRVRKRMGSKRAYLLRAITEIGSKDPDMSGRLIVSVECLGQTPGNQGAHIYTVGPNSWSKHFSPMIGRLTGVKDEDSGGEVGSYNFQATQIQLSGPVPTPLYHRYVEFKPFVAGMFNSQSLRGRILNRALHHQHHRIYDYDRSTEYGVFNEPSIDLTKQFLDFVHYDQGGRIFTYVLTLDGQWRFTETGKEFGIDMLSKHTMHSNVSIYIAYSGEFFVRRRPQATAENSTQNPTSEITEESSSSEEPSQDPSDYELVIDNDSGTYRPNAQYLPVLKQFLSSNLPSLQIKTLDSQKDAEYMARLKGEQRDRKHKEGHRITYLQRMSSINSSISSSDEEELQERSGQPKERHGVARRYHTMKKNPRGKFMDWVEGAEGTRNLANSGNGRPATAPGIGAAQRAG
ncbi:hypothetical protein FQN54_000625 [Arachnomyces sp. PD_36]|nr:hypothetical protein FQN54_000625 [Arachnomyces sp. PD_36]